MEELKQWATCISVLYEGIIYLSFMTEPMTVLQIDRVIASGRWVLTMLADASY